MKTRYLVLGLSMGLALSVAVPALGGPLALRSSSIASVKLLAKKALTAANAAQGAAGAAQGTATAAQGAASGAQSTANTAKTAASSAQSTANGAQSTAANALGKADATATQLVTVEHAANDAATTANGKIGKTQQVSADSTDPGIIKTALAQCPQGTKVTGGGFGINQNSEIKISEPEGNGWEAVAVGTGGHTDFTLKAWALCGEP
jgi:trimeric autotransporter adhesin